MALILAIETDTRQAATLKRVVRDHVSARLVVVSSREEALAAIAADIPDLVLVSALLSPRDEEEIVAHLRTLDAAGHLQTLTIPHLADHEREEPGGWRRVWRRRRAAESVTGCDPHRFGEAIADYLARAEAIREAARREKTPPTATAAVETKAALDVPPQPDEKDTRSRAPAAPVVATTPPRTSPGPRPAPLAVWARRAKPSDDRGHETPGGQIRYGGETRAILASLALPRGVAEAGIHGCRIRRVTTHRHTLNSVVSANRDEPIGGDSLHAVA